MKSKHPIRGCVAEEWMKLEMHLMLGELGRGDVAPRHQFVLDASSKLENIIRRVCLFQPPSGKYDQEGCQECHAVIRINTVGNPPSGQKRLLKLPQWPFKFNLILNCFSN